MKMQRCGGGKNSKISVKLAVLYMLLLLVSWAMLFFIFYRVSYKNVVDSAQTLSSQTRSTVGKNVATLIDNVAYYSRIILSSSDITQALETKDRDALEESLHQFISLIDSETHINGIYLWDMDNNSCSIDKNHVRVLRTDNIKDTTWYQEVMQLKGSYLLKLNADRILTHSKADTTVSLIRVVNDPSDFKPVGILMVHIDQEAFVECSNTDDNSISTIYILDDTGKIVTSRAEITLPQFQKMLGESNGQEQNSNEKVLVSGTGRELYLLSETKMEQLGWKVLVGIPIRNRLTGSGLGGMIFMLAMIFLTLFCGVGYLLMKYYVADPLEVMAASMNRMKERKFEKIDVDRRRIANCAEMNILLGTYNQMVDEIEALIDKVYEEEKVKRRAELNALQEQMKPHFLYNTIDAMSYLALSGKNEEVYDALEAFGSYYRTLLSKGREMILVKEEMTMVKDYLELQKLRYGDSLRYVLEVQESIKKTYILKMILQPLVENSVNHGIRPKVTPGVVFVEGIQEGGYLKFTVEDDGVGMSQEEIRSLSRVNLTSNEKSFGLRGTIERLKIFYDLDIDYKVESREGKGTTIQLRIPIRYEGEES